MHDLRASLSEPGKNPRRVALNPESRILNPALDAGVALLAVMSTVTVLVLIALAFSGSVQLETRTAIYRKESTQAYGLATGGVQAVILDIAYPPAEDQKDKPRLWKKGQRLARVPYEHGEALVEIVSESGKLDLNVAGREQLVRLFEARGLNRRMPPSWRRPLITGGAQRLRTRSPRPWTTIIATPAIAPLTIASVQ